MIKISQIKMPIDQEESIFIPKEIRRLLRLKEREVFTYTIEKQSLDARKKPKLYFNYAICIHLERQELEQEIFKKSGLKENEGRYIIEEEERYLYIGHTHLAHRPVVVGSGPAGLFAAYYLAKAGYNPLVIERGQEVSKRQKIVESFWQGGDLDIQTNVQFGEGGAGTFSDGKLGTLIKDKKNLKLEVFKILVEAGAPREILYHYQPHIGTDILAQVVQNIRKEIIRLGGEVRFNTCVTDFYIRNQELTKIQVNHKEWIDTSHLILAIGHSARDTFERLNYHQVPLEAKNFAVGFRIQHPQGWINTSQYGQEQVCQLGAASYKLSHTTQAKRGVYSFCMCPGGYVVNASSEEGYLAVNGMSYHGRDSHNANSAIVVSVSKEDFGIDPLGGMYFQRQLEKRAYEIGQGRIPIMRYGDFKDKIEKQVIQQKYSLGSVIPCCKGEILLTDITSILPNNLNKEIIEGIENMGKKIKGFNQGDSLLAGVESRTSSPIRILRDKRTYQSLIKGLYPCGEGAGYAGGITSAAIDGMKVAMAICGI